MKLSVVCSVVLAAGLALAPAAWAKPTSLIVFGDSLVDAGNLDAALGSDMFNPQVLGYFPGRFTNGLDYTDYLNRSITGSVLTASLLGGTDYAFGGARAVDVGEGIPALPTQVGAYLAGAGMADPNALYIINIGGNDVFGLDASDIGAFTPAAYAAQVAANIAGSVAALDAAGARDILVTGMPVPDANGFALDAEVSGALDLLQPSLHSQLKRFSYFDFFQAVASDPSAFGLPPFISLSTPCLSVRSAVGGQIDCSGYFSFDGIHPTAQVQQALFQDVASLAGVPEPAAWTLMIGGFALVGAGLRRRHAVAA